MGNMRIIEIPASMRESALRKNTVRKLRVAAYCRVSTEEEEQQGSFEIQKLYYTEKINSTPEWEVAGIYADDGISGVHTKKRDGFNQMIQDCKKHRIDLILTKSISRFARNTLDSIQYVRMLKQMGIAVVFEKENINTATMNSEMILTVLSAFAQAESESISQNVARGKRMGYKHGKFAFPYGRIIGYRKGADGKPEIIPEMQQENDLTQEYEKLLASAQIPFEGKTYTLSQLTPLKSDPDDARRLAAWQADAKWSMEHAAELDADIEKYAKGWRFERISLVASAIMRVAMYEMLYMADIPAGVAINEAVEIAKKYETPETVKFINGILGSFVRAEISAE